MNSAGETFVLMQSDLAAGGLGLPVIDFINQEVRVDAIGPIFNFSLVGVLAEVFDNGRAVLETSAGVVHLPSGLFVITGSRDSDGRVIITVIGK